MYAYCRNEPGFRKDSLGTDDVCIAHADDDCNPLNDFDGTPTGNGGMYHYSVDFSAALNSSLINGGIYNCGYSAYGYTSGGYGGSGKAPSSSGNASIKTQLQQVAQKVNSTIKGSGPVIGTKKHALFKELAMELNLPNVKFEASYIKEGDSYREAYYGERGSIRFDAVEVDAGGHPIRAWDFKTGGAVLTSSRISHMRQASGIRGLPIDMIK